MYDVTVADMNGLNRYLYVYIAHGMYMDEDHDDWAPFWDSKTDEFLEGYCFGEDTTWYCWQGDGFVQHHCLKTGLVYTWEELE
ncbi:MAG: hypothetical protein [Circular genetic element sp.]|nr:MAG: hypothetical protein [Circular genetic element sp.]